MNNQDNCGAAPAAVDAQHLVDRLVERFGAHDARTRLLNRVIASRELGGEELYVLACLLESADEQGIACIEGERFQIDLGAAIAAPATTRTSIAADRGDL